MSLLVITSSSNHYLYIHQSLPTYTMLLHALPPTQHKLTKARTNITARTRPFGELKT